MKKEEIDNTGREGENTGDGREFPSATGVIGGITAASGALVGGAAAMSTMASGAAAGSAAGPIGAVIGAVAGAAIGAMIEQRGGGNTPPGEEKVGFDKASSPESTRANQDSAPGSTRPL